MLRDFEKVTLRVTILVVGIACVPCVWPLYIQGQSVVAETPAGKSSRVTNRAVLTVGGEVYTSTDAVLILALWNALGEPRVALSTSWLADLRIRIEKDRDALQTVLNWPADVRRLLGIGLVWHEAKRLNLFVPGEKELEAALQKVSLEQGLVGMPAPVLSFWNALPVTKKRFYIELVLRARTYEKVRGSLQKNPALLNASWFWHAAQR